MFTRFSTPHRRPTATLGGTFVSLTAHAAIVAVAVGGDLIGRAHVGGSPGLRASGGGGERLHWVGIGDGSGPERPTPRPGSRPPVAYVVPGHGTPREGATRVAEPKPRPSRAGAPPATERSRSVARLPVWRRIELPALPDIDAAILVAGVVSAAPDPSRMLSRPEDFVRRPLAEAFGDDTTTLDVRPSGMQLTSGRIDELPIAMIDNPRPTYPTMLARAGIGGRVLVEFTIDSVGAIDLRSLRVLQSTNAMFTQAVRTILPRLRFLPAQLGRHAVGVTVRQPFVFTMRRGA